MTFCLRESSRRSVSQAASDPSGTPRRRLALPLRRVRALTLPFVRPTSGGSAGSGELGSAGAVGRGGARAPGASEVAEPLRAMRGARGVAREDSSDSAGRAAGPAVIWGIGGLPVSTLATWRRALATCGAASATAELSPPGAASPKLGGAGAREATVGRSRWVRFEALATSRNSAGRERGARSGAGSGTEGAARREGCRCSGGGSGLLGVAARASMRSSGRCVAGSGRLGTGRATGLGSGTTRCASGASGGTTSSFFGGSGSGTDRSEGGGGTGAGTGLRAGGGGSRATTSSAGSGSGVWNATIWTPPVSESTLTTVRAVAMASMANSAKMPVLVAARRRLGLLGAWRSSQTQ